MMLRDLLVQKIIANGPLSLADYMADCLLHPQFGYYSTGTPFGVEGDFTTAPEISQMFGEVVGLCLAQCWLDQGRPSPFTLADLGPGRGSLMADILRATKAVPGFYDAAEVTLIEASPKLRDVQRDNLKGVPVKFIDTAQDLPEQALFATANEFFDALPIRQFVRTKTSWREKQIGQTDGVLHIGLGPELPQPALAERLTDTQPGDLIEYCPSAAPIAQQIGARIAGYGGAGLVIDYGDWHSLGDTLQAVKAQESVDPLANPGHADLTTHVDFEALARALPCAHTRLTPQGVFLERLGITQRAQKLAGALSGDKLRAHILAHQRLTHPEEMGTLFKVLGLFPAGKPPPPGLEQ